MASVPWWVSSQVEPGNIDLDILKRPRVVNPDGSASTVRSMSFGMDGNEILVPTVADDSSHIMSDDEAIQRYIQTGRHLGKFSNPAAADAAGGQIHREQEAQANALLTPMVDMLFRMFRQ